MTFTKTALSYVLLLAMISTKVVALTCTNENTAIIATTPTADFTIHNDGTVTHNLTGLMWKQCSQGQLWDGVTCAGSANAYTWQIALAQADADNFASYDDWRLPNKNELASIIEQRCYNPSINTDIFTDTPSGWFWSSSPDAKDGSRVWVVDNGGGIPSYEKYYYGYVRLVRDVQSSGPDDSNGPDPRPGSKASVNLNNLSGHMLLLYSASAKTYAAAHFDGENDLFYVAAGISSESQKGGAVDSEGIWTVEQNKLTLTVVERTPLTITADADGNFQLGKTYQSTQGDWSVVDISSMPEFRHPKHCKIKKTAARNYILKYL